jgi:hypothetical protein
LLALPTGLRELEVRYSFTPSDLEFIGAHQDAAKILHDERGNNILAQAANLLTGDEH